MQYQQPENYELVKEALLLAHREDLIGFDKKCLIPPRKMGNGGKKKKSAGSGRETEPEGGRKNALKVRKTAAPNGKKVVGKDGGGSRRNISRNSSTAAEGRR